MLRYGSRYLSKFMFEPNKNVFQYSKVFVASVKSSDPEDSASEKAKSQSVETDLLSDLYKFKNESRIILPRSAVKSEDYALGSQNDPDTFGTLSKSNPYLLSVQEGSEEDQAEDKYISELPNYLPQKEYVQKIKRLLNQRRFADALDVLQVTMLKEHRVKPEYYIYSILIAYCGKTGYTKMAFKLYNDMKKRGLKVTSSVYTSLFNSCANSAFPADGLMRTRRLFSYMNERGIELNQINCHAIIKAFGRCGSIEDSFKVVDYMMQHKMTLKVETFSFLFHACISDKEAGFRHALLVYRKMMQYRIKPDLFTFNLFLHCIRDCSIGDFSSMVAVLKELGVKGAETLAEGKQEEKASEPGYPWEEDEKLAANVVAGTATEIFPLAETKAVQEPIEVLPNLLSLSPTLGCIVNLSDIVHPQDRLLLLGGVEGFLKEMVKHKVKCDIKTISMLLECIPQTCSAEEGMLKIGEKLNVTFDLLFFNTLIRRRCLRGQYEEAKEVLPFITKHGFQPDSMTFTNLAMACRSTPDAYELLKAVDECGLRPNIELVTNLFGGAESFYHMDTIKLIFDTIEYEEMKVNSVFMKKVDSFYEKCGRVLKIRPEKFSERTLNELDRFCRMYPKWKKSVEVEDTNVHPWQHLREKYAPTVSNTDEEFLSEHVETATQASKFPNKGPDTLPKLKRAHMKMLKQENPEMFRRRRPMSSRKVDKLEGIDNVSYQELPK